MRALALLPLLAACQQPIQKPDINAALARLNAVTLADLNAAAADAQAHGDVLAVACYPALANWVITLQEGSGKLAPPMGAFDSFQKARDAYKALSGANGGLSSVPNSVKLGCSALYLDAKGDLVSFIALLAQIASGTYVPLLP